MENKEEKIEQQASEQETQAAANEKVQEEPKEEVKQEETPAEETPVNGGMSDEELKAVEQAFDQQQMDFNGSEVSPY